MYVMSLYAHEKKHKIFPAKYGNQTSVYMMSLNTGT